VPQAQVTNISQRNAHYSHAYLSPSIWVGNGNRTWQAGHTMTRQLSWQDRTHSDSAVYWATAVKPGTTAGEQTDRQTALFSIHRHQSLHCNTGDSQEQGVGRRTTGDSDTD